MTTSTSVDYSRKNRETTDFLGKKLSTIVCLFSSSNTAGIQLRAILELAGGVAVDMSSRRVWVRKQFVALLSPFKPFKRNVCNNGAIAKGHTVSCCPNPKITFVFETPGFFDFSNNSKHRRRSRQ